MQKTPNRSAHTDAQQQVSATRRMLRAGGLQRLGSTNTPHMNLSDFSIGLEFWCGDKRWRCTDVGTRVVTAICLEPREMVRSGVDPIDTTKRIQTTYISNDPRDLNGPPYGVVESVFDEYDMEACNIEREDS